MKFFAVLSVCGFFSGYLYAAQELISDDGRQVRLNDDGSWVYLSTDRFATTADGQRVRLKQDGSWEYTGQMITEKNIRAGQNVMSNRQFIDAKSLGIELADLVIETYRGKKSEAHKNSRKQTQSVFHVDVIVAGDAKKAVSLSLQNSNFSIEDTSGREYEVLTVKPAQAIIEPGNELRITVRADGSPHWWTTRSMSLRLDKNLFDSKKDIVLSRDMSQAKKKRVEGFE